MPTPKKRRQPRTIRTAKKPDDWKKFLRELEKCGNVTAACRKSGLGKQTAFTHRKEDLEFAAAWEEALGTAADRLEEEADRRASRGVDKLIVSKGRPMILSVDQGRSLPGFVEAKDGDGNSFGYGYVVERHYSDTLLIFLLKAARPDKFADRKKIEANHTGEIAVSKSLAEEIAAARASRSVAELEAASSQEMPPAPTENTSPFDAA